MQPTRSAALLAALLLAGAPLAAQTSDAQARDEIAFARGLAAEWGFVDLAQEVIADLEQAGVSKKVAEEVALAKCAVYFEGGKADRTRRGELLEQALAAYRDFVAGHSYSELLPQAESELIGVTSYYTRYLSSELADAVGEEAEALRAKLAAVLDVAVEKTGELIGGLQAIPEADRSEAERRSLYELLFNRGEMMLELAKSQEDGTYSFEASFRAFETLFDEAGEGSPWGLRALIGIGDNLMAQGDPGEASSYYEFVVETAIPRDLAAWEQAKDEQGMSLEEIEQRFLFVQMATGGLVESLAAAGKTEAAAAWGLHYYDVWKREGLELVQPMGHLSLLSVARTLVDAGGAVAGDPAQGGARWFATPEEAAAEYPNPRDRRSAIDMALGFAQTVNTENRGNTLQLRAQSVIAEIISRPGVQVDPEVLFEAAQGHYFDKDYPAAIHGFKRVLASLEGEDPAKQQEIGSKTLWHIGRSFQSLDRQLEAAVAFREAVDPLGRWRGDPQYDGQNAEKYYEAMRALRSNIAGDELIDAWWRDAENWAKDLTETLGAEVGFRDAWELFTDEKFAEAKEAFELVTTDAESYEKALVYVGVCEFKLEELEAAEATFDRYLNQFLVNPVNAVHDPRRRAKRSEAESSAWFYWGLCAYREAELGQGDWGDVVAKLADFHTRFPDQPSLSPAALYRVMIAHTKLHDNASARAVYEELLESFGSSQWTGRAAKDYFEVLEAQRQAEQDPAAKEALLRQMADALQVLNANSPEPSFANMRRESRLWMDLGDWAAAEALLERIVVQFEATEAKDIDKFVRPDLGEALMRQHKVADAAEILAPLVEAKVADRDTARNYALVLSGWLDYGDGKPVLQQVAGLGGPGNLERAAQILDQITEGTEKWEPEWYRLKAEQIYVYVLWGALDGKKLETARDQIQFLITNVGAQFQDDKIDEPLRAKFAWLAKELK